MDNTVITDQPLCKQMLASRLSKRVRPLLLVVFILAIAGTSHFLRARHLPSTATTTLNTIPNTSTSTSNTIQPTNTIRYNTATLLTTIDGDWDATKEDQVRLLAGSLHRYRPANKLAPRLIVFCEKAPSLAFVEETEAWEEVSLRLVVTALGAPLTGAVVVGKGMGQVVRRALLRRIMSEHTGNNGGVVAWIKAGLIYDPLPAAVKEAMGKPGTIGNPPAIIRPVYKRARNFLKNLSRLALEEGVVEGWSESGKEVWVEAYGDISVLERRIHDDLYNHTNISDISKHKARDFGFAPKPPYTDAACYVDIRTDLVDNAVMLAEIDGFDTQPITSGDPNKKALVIGLPLTSKGAHIDDDPVLLKALVPSIDKTVTEAEWSRFDISLYIAFDHADPLWDDADRRKQIRDNINALTNNRLRAVKMYRMLRARRVAMLWSMLYGKAIRDGAHLFFQVNDDLTLDTAGWLSHYAGKLAANNDFGVAGPFDPHNGINCAVLTQAMVGRLHHRIFKSLYPVEMRDWKTDRWLTHVYNDDVTGPGGYGNNTWCSTDFVARNGAAKTRYKHCEFLSWQLYVEEGRNRIRRYLQEHGRN